MSYRSDSIPLEAVFSASLKTGLLGAVLFSAFAATQWLSLDDMAMPGAVIFAFFIVLFVGGTATALSLVIFGIPLANYGYRFFTSKGGIILTLASALTVSLALSAIIGIELLPYALIFAIPAGLFFRSEILLHRAIEK